MGVHDIQVQLAMGVRTGAAGQGCTYRCSGKQEELIWTNPGLRFNPLCLHVRLYIKTGYTIINTGIGQESRI